MTNVNAQEWLNEKYPKDDTCKRETLDEGWNKSRGWNNKNKKREDITKLDIREGKVGSSLKGKILVGSLKFEGFINLQTLICSSHQIVNLDISNCPNLEELDCHGNELTNLNLSGCHNLKKINCSSNHIRVLDLSSCDKLEEVNCNSNNSLEEVDVSSCSRLIKVGSGFTYDNKHKKLIKNISQITLAKDNDVRNILIIGITGNGKSTLANVLASTDQFEEGDYSTSLTKTFQSKFFTWKSKKYRVIDNIGFGDTSADPSKEDILYEIGKGIHSAKEGINQVLFIFKGKFTPEQVNAFDSFKNFVFETGITRITTLVRTNFKGFRNQELCDKDLENLLSESKKISEVINSCNGIIYVDNPFVNISAPDDEEEDEREKRNKKIDSNKETREKSREVVLNYLAENCQEIYRLKEWENIHNQVAEYVKKKKEIEGKKIGKIEKQNELEKERRLLADEIKVRLGINIVTLDAFIEVATTNPKWCCSIS